MLGFLTVQELRQAVNAIPNTANAAELGIPSDDCASLPVVVNHTKTADGDFYTVIGYLDLLAKTYRAAPGQ